MAAALCFLESKGIVHGSVCARNVLVSEGKRSGERLDLVSCGRVDAQTVVSPAVAGHRVVKLAGFERAQLATAPLTSDAAPASLVPWLSAELLATPSLAPSHKRSARGARASIALSAHRAS